MARSFRPAIDTTDKNYVHVHAYRPQPAPRHLTRTENDVTDDSIVTVNQRQTGSEVVVKGMSSRLIFTVPVSGVCAPVLI